MPDLAWNKSCWDGGYNWTRSGEEWSEGWGGSEAQWFGCLYPRLHRFLPVGNLLEIAPGFGRWTHYLLEYVHGRYTGVDLSQACIEYCKERFSRFSNTAFLVNDGLSLDSVEDGVFDLVFSFDSLVHANLDVHQTYIPQILRKLTQNGVAFIHHSNWAQSGSTNVNVHNRAEDVSAAAYAKIVKQAGGHVMLQECLNWGMEEKIDAFTLFCVADRDVLPEMLLIENSEFMLEAHIIREIQSRYTKITCVQNSGDSLANSDDRTLANTHQVSLLKKRSASLEIECEKLRTYAEKLEQLRSDQELQIREQRRILQEKNRSLQEQRREALKLENQLQRALAEKDSLLKSLSWRLTSPLRRVGRIFEKRSQHL